LNFGAMQPLQIPEGGPQSSKGSSANLPRRRFPF